MSEEKLPDDVFMERAAEISMEWFDITPVALALEAEYQRGVVDGGLAVNEKFAEKLAAEYRRGMDDYRDELLRNLDAKRAPIAKSIEETSQEKPAAPARPSDTPEPEKRTGEAPIAPEKARGARGDTSQPRPAGLPTMFEMIGAVLDKTPGLTAQQVADVIRERWWPGMDFKRIGPEFSTWIRKGRLIRDDDGKLTLSVSGRNVAGLTKVQQAIVKQESAPPAPVFVRPPPAPPRQVVTPGAKLGPPARGGHAMPFTRRGQTVLLAHRELAIAGVLQAAMGKGHVDTQFLAQKALGSDKRNAIDNESLLRDLVSIMNPKLETLRLNIEFHKGFGFIMKDLPA